jgi:hypothetical protein
MTQPAPGTIPALPYYQNGALTLAGTEIVEIASSQNATAAASYQLLITDLVGKAPLNMNGAVPSSGDLVAFFQVATNLPKATSFASITSALNLGTQRSITTANFTILNTDRYLNINVSTAASCTLPSYTVRSGVPLTFKDVSGAAFLNNITINALGTQTIDGTTSFVITNSYQALTINPFTDGVNTGWFVT